MIQTHYLFGIPSKSVGGVIKGISAEKVVTPEMT